MLSKDENLITTLIVILFYKELLFIIKQLLFIVFKTIFILIKNKST